MTKKRKEERRTGIAVDDASENWINQYRRDRRAEEADKADSEPESPKKRD